ncbi:hypothetical protein CTI12_AA196520 [Artemisia annua]|uniref:Transcriptional coactivator p15 (PC4) C-terminal domain-containing protein n=1 Tax=Artemisia annua TaxID=35608 RepID=A0A2U1P405_ARTAN|nr:hypothetical protein CTI12_AA196520 [Artemisia annua]
MTHGSTLENAILEMETMVADSRRVHEEIQDVDHPVATKSRLPCELKQKLEIVARLAHSSQGRISDEIILRLTSILGHWLKPRAIKRCLRDMVPSDLSACGGDGARFIQFKKEVIEMIELRNPSMATEDVSKSETLGLHAPFKAKYSMDNEMEDKICDFYDIYVQGMNQIKSSEIRKFYIQLAALWPKGTMDNHGIRNAICRSKERQRTVFQEEKGHEKGKQKSSNARMDEEDLHGEAKLLYDTERSVNDANTSNSTFLDSVVPGTPELDQNLSAPAKRFSPPSASSCHDLKQGKFNIFNETRKGNDEEDSDHAPPPPKKAFKKDQTSDEEEKTEEDGSIFICEVSKNRRVSVRNFKGKVYVDIREFYLKDGKLSAGKRTYVIVALEVTVQCAVLTISRIRNCALVKSISLSMDQWKELRAHVDEIDKALAE